MKLQNVIMKDFKRFTDLQVTNLPESARLIVLAGPNGCGKSSFFDAFKVWHGFNGGPTGGQFDYIYHSKQSIESNIPEHARVLIDFHSRDEDQNYDPKKRFYFRSAYRVEPDFQLEVLQQQCSILDDYRFYKLIDNDQAVKRNYERLVSGAVSDLYKAELGNITFDQYKEQTIGSIRRSVQELFSDLELSDLNDPLVDGTFRFSKGASTDFHFKNLSGGEKAAFDLILDLIIARREFDDTIFCIDEPDLHMNTRIQSNLLQVLYDLVPENCQLVLATHSIGMMRKAAEIEKLNPNTVIFLNFDKRNFDDSVIIEPSPLNRTFWKNTFAVALDDLSDLIAPRQIIICEGTPRKDSNTYVKNENQDARCYDCIFANEFPDTKFVSAGGANEVKTDRIGVSSILESLILGVKIERLIDRDDQSDEELIENKNDGNRVLKRRNLESYLFSDEILRKLCESASFPEKVSQIIQARDDELRKQGGRLDDFKKARGVVYNECKNQLKLTKSGNTVEAFMRDTLAPLVTPETKVYKELREIIFDLIPN